MAWLVSRVANMVYHHHRGHLSQHSHFYHLQEKKIEFVFEIDKKRISIFSLSLWCGVGGGLDVDSVLMESVRASLFFRQRVIVSKVQYITHHTIPSKVCVRTVVDVRELRFLHYKVPQKQLFQDKNSSSWKKWS